MPATRYRFAAWLLCLGLLAARPGHTQTSAPAPAPAPALAPAPAAVVPTAAPDTTGFDDRAFSRPRDRYYLGELVKADGTRLAVYLPVNLVGYERHLYYFTQRPAPNASAEPQRLNIEQVRSMTVRGRTSETVCRPDGRPLNILALRVQQGPIDLLTHVEPRSLPVPIFGGVGVAMPMLNIPLSDKHNWYLRRNGVMTQLKRADFAHRMSQYLFDYPDLAAKVAAGQPGYQPRDVPAIVAEYNRFKSQPPAK